MVINLITFASLLHKQASVRSSHEIILNELEKYFTVNFIDYQDINKLSPRRFQHPVHRHRRSGTAGYPAFRGSSPPCHHPGRRYAELACRRPRNIFLAAQPGNEKRNPAWRTVRNYQTHFCTAQQFHGTTQVSTECVSV